MKHFFGTDGVRGVANKELTSEMAFNIGRAVAIVLGEGSEKPLFVVGKDTRISGDMLESALISGILSKGGDVIKAGIITTPAVAYLTQICNADSGIVISASHNSFEYNGIKLFNSKGFKLDDEIEQAVEKILISGIYDNKKEYIGSSVGKCIEKDCDLQEKYIDFLMKTIDMDLKGLKVVLDSANGAAYKIAKDVYKRLGATIINIFDEPNGININSDCGSTHPENLMKKVLEEKADIGFAYDGDADRLIAVDEKGRLLDGDIILAICATKLKEKNKLKKNRITATIMSNIGLMKHMEALNIDVDTTGVGDRCVIESMEKTGSVIGGEQSGHMIFREFATTGDGILSSLQLTKAYLGSGRKLSELKDEIKIYPQALINVEVLNNNKNMVKDDEEVKKIVEIIEKRLNDKGRVLLRASGTEPKIRVMIEGENQKEVNGYAKEIADVIERKFGF